MLSRREYESLLSKTYQRKVISEWLNDERKKKRENKKVCRETKTEKHEEVEIKEFENTHTYDISGQESYDSIDRRWDKNSSSQLRRQP